MVNLRRQFKVCDFLTASAAFAHVTDLDRVICFLQELLRTHGLLEENTGGRTGPQDRARRRERLTERHKLHQLKRDHELQENTKRKVLRLEEGLEGDALSGSDDEGAGSSKKRRDDAEQTVDIQVQRIFHTHVVPDMYTFFGTLKTRYFEECW